MTHVGGRGSTEPDPSLSGAYNLPDGQVPMVDGEPRWPWDEEVARARLGTVAARLGLTVTGQESRLDGASNDTWLLGDAVLRVCWRGDPDRLVREAALLSALPAGFPVPRPLACDRDGRLSWLLMPRLPGVTLADAWPTSTSADLRGHVRELGELVRALHDWQPPAELRAMIEAAAPDDADDALTITGKRLVPLAHRQQLRLIDYLRTVPYVPGELLDAVLARLPEQRPVESAVLLHGDATPGNVLVHEGRIGGLLDWEWAGFGPPHLESALPVWWARCSGHGEFVDWLIADCPELAGDPAQRWVCLAAFALRCMVHWPPDRPEAQLYRDHPMVLLRELVS